MKEQSCLVLGDIFADVTLQAMSMPIPGGRQPLKKADLRLGGSGCVTALALKSLGMPVRLAGNVGDDNLGDYALDQIRRAGLDKSLIQVLPGGQTGFFMTVLSFGAERTLFTARGANDQILPYEELTSALDSCAHLHISGYTLQGDSQSETARRLAESAFGRGLSVSLDPGVCSTQNMPEKVLGLLPWVSFFLPNRAELAALTGQNEIDDGLDRLMKNYCGGVALKLDGEGSRYVDGRVDAIVPADEISNHADLTGAGDGFNAGFLFAVLNGKPPKEALAAGNAMAARLLNSRRGVMGLFSGK